MATRSETDEAREQTAEERPADSEGRAEADRGPVGTWRIDPERSTFGFTVKKMGLYDVKGYFQPTEGTIELPAGEEPKARATLDATSVNTRIAPRDAHLRSEQFLDVDEHPRMHFRSTGVEPLGDGRNRIEGELEIRDCTGPVELEAVIEHRADETLHMRLEGTLGRHQFGIRPPQPFEMIVGDDVRLEIELVAVPA